MLRWVNFRRRLPSKVGQFCTPINMLDAQREAQSAMLDPKKQNNKPFLPGQNTLQYLLQLINEDERQFKSVQTLIALLAFTYYKKEA